MRTLRQRLGFNGTAWNLGVSLLLAGLLGGCSGQPFVNVIVQVDTCQAGGMEKQFGQLTPPGACNQTLLTNNTTDPNKYNNAWNMATNTAMADHDHRCNTNTWMCQSDPGSKACPIPPNKPCKTRFTPTAGIYGNCTCGCPP